jgi:RNA polymerase sigma factor (sigma-70 family)
VHEPPEESPRPISTTRTTHLTTLRQTGAAWIAGIARNLGRTWSRTSARRRRHADAIAAESELSATAPTPLEAALDRESRTLLRQALDNIPSAYREVLVLFYVHGQAVAEVAVGLGVTEDVVKQRLLRGRRALRESLERGAEDALGKVGPSKAFTSIVMVAVSSAIATKGAAAATTAKVSGKLIAIMSANKVILGVASIALASGGVWYGLSRGDAAPATRATVEPRNASSAAIASIAHPPATPARSRSGARRFADAAERELLLQSVRLAQQRRHGPAPRTASSAGSTPDDVGPRDLDKDYISSSVRELVPFIQECYETMLETQPTVQGTVVVNFTIEGEPESGGLVTECAIDDKSDLKDPMFQECMRETMFALEIDPPRNGGVVKVVYPFTFRFDEP